MRERASERSGRRKMAGNGVASYYVPAIDRARTIWLPNDSASSDPNITIYHGPCMQIIPTLHLASIGLYCIVEHSVLGLDVLILRGEGEIKMAMRVHRQEANIGHHVPMQRQLRFDSSVHRVSLCTACKEGQGISRRGSMDGQSLTEVPRRRQPRGTRT